MNAYEIMSQDTRTTEELAGLQRMFLMMRFLSSQKLLREKLSEDR